MSDREAGKKATEREGLDPFLEAYELVTDDELTVVTSCENPDFICERTDGTEVGVELTRVMRDPRDAFWEKVLDRQEQIDPYEAQERIYQLIEKKEVARLARYTSRVKDVILVLQLVDGGLDLIQGALEGLEEDFAGHGFQEIWLVDYSGVEAYGDVELFGLYPQHWWGYHPRQSPGKPYG